MGKFRTCAVTLKQGQEVFRGGERVSGTVMLDVAEPVAVKGVRVFCHGQALTKWTKDFSRDINSDQISTERYFASVYTLFGKKQNEDGPNLTLSSGKHRWAFAFRLPEGRLPSSFEGQYGAIRWFLKVEVDKPFPSINNKWYKPFTVLSDLDINEPVYQPPIKKEVSKTVSKALGLGNAGTLTLFAQTDHFGYCPGENIGLKVDAHNNSSKDLGKLLIVLNQSVTFTANDETKSNSNVVASMQTERSLAKGTTMTLADLQLPVPAIPPSTRKRTCHIISCTYTVKVSVQVPWGLNLDAVIPVAIGTVPRGYKLPSTAPGAAARGASSSAAVTPRTIPYVKCAWGTSPCSRSHNNFPNLSYTPLTAFHYPPPPTVPPFPLAATPAPSKASSSSTAAQQQRATALRSETGETLGLPGPAGAAGGMRYAAGPTPPPAYTRSPPSLPSAAPQEDLPPAYDDIMGEEEEEEEPTQTTAVQAAAAKPADEGRKCVILLARFPDSSLSSFRQTIQREQNNLMDTDLAFLAALSPQPLCTVDKEEDFWPEHHALALLVFPEEGSGEEWVRGVEERGDSWIHGSDILMMPASWAVPQEVNDRLVFNISTSRVREGASQKQIAPLVKTITPLTVKLREDHGGIRVAMSKKTKILHGQWVSADHFVTVIYWPKARNYMAYKLELAKAAFMPQLQELHTLLETQSALLFSEDVTSLSTESATSPDDDDGDDNDDDDGNEEGVDERVDDLLGSEERQQQQTASDNSNNSGDDGVL